MPLDLNLRPLAGAAVVIIMAGAKATAVADWVVSVQFFLNTPPNKPCLNRCTKNFRPIFTCSAICSVKSFAVRRASKRSNWKNAFARSRKCGGTIATEPAKSPPGSSQLVESLDLRQDSRSRARLHALLPTDQRCRRPSSGSRAASADAGRSAAARSANRSARPSPTCGTAASTNSRCSRLLDGLHIEPVFTAHPTEAKRRTLISKLKRIEEGLQQARRRAICCPATKPASKQELLAEVTILWLTAQARVTKPSVTDEVKTGLYYFDSTIWDVVPKVYREIEEAPRRTLSRREVAATVLDIWQLDWRRSRRQPERHCVCHGRDNASASRPALSRHGDTAGGLTRSLSLSEQLHQPDAGNDDAAREESAEFSGHVKFLAEQYPEEPYRLLAAALKADLNDANHDPVKSRLLENNNSPMADLQTADDLLKPLSSMDASLRERPHRRDRQCRFERRA